MTMQLIATIGDQRFAVNLDAPRDISIPLRFDGVVPRVFGAAPASKTPYAAGGFIGDVRQGGSCNCDIITVAPHLHGTHTESVGHIASTLVSIHETLQECLIPATLITVTPRMADAASETYDPPLRPIDKLITRPALERCLKNADKRFLDGLVIRTLPNTPAKRIQDYGRDRPAFFSVEAMRLIVELGVQHLLTDLPSIDRSDDEGKLTNHHLYWNVPFGDHPATGEAMSAKTITELIYVPDDVPDGTYLLNLQLAPFMADASPSRPILFELRPA
jgi:hypothetical protein